MDQGQDQRPVLKVSGQAPLQYSGNIELDLREKMYAKCAEAFIKGCTAALVSILLGSRTISQFVWQSFPYVMRPEST